MKTSKKSIADRCAALPSFWGSGLRAGIALSLLLLLSTPGTLHAECIQPLGDLTQDAEINVVDVQCSILTVLSSLESENATPPNCLNGGGEALADLNCVDGVTVTDVQLVIQFTLQQPLSFELDINGNSCPDTCEVLPYCGNQEDNGCKPCPAGSIAESADACTPCSAGSFQSEWSCEPCPAGWTSEAGSVECTLVAKGDSFLDIRDYGFLFWPTNHWIQWNNFLNVHYVQTGAYGLAIDVSTGSLTQLGLLEEEMDSSVAVSQPASLVGNLASASVSYGVTLNGASHTANAFLQEDGTASNPSRLIWVDSCNESIFPR